MPPNAIGCPSCSEDLRMGIFQRAESNLKSDLVSDNFQPIIWNV